MATITAADVKKLRDLTAAGMMECKRALEESDGDFDKAVELLRISGAAKAAKRGAEREASNGLVAAEGNALIELLCETDFVAKNADFLALAGQIATVANDAQVADRAQLLEVIASLGSHRARGRGRDVRRHRREDRARPGGRARGSCRRVPAPSCFRPAAQVGVIIAFTGDEAAARGAAMQVAAMRPQYLTREEVPADVVANERHIAEETAKEEGKPEAAMSKIIEGRVNSYFKDTVLLEQPSVVDSKKTVAQVLVGVRHHGDRLRPVRARPGLAAILDGVGRARTGRDD